MDLWETEYGDVDWIYADKDPILLHPTSSGNETLASVKTEEFIDQLTINFSCYRQFQNLKQFLKRIPLDIYTKEFPKQK